MKREELKKILEDSIKQIKSELADDRISADSKREQQELEIKEEVLEVYKKTLENINSIEDDKIDGIIARFKEINN